MQPIILICGLLGTGKTTASKILEKELPEYIRFNTDDTRHKLGLKKFDIKDTPTVNATMYDSARDLLNNKKPIMFESAYKTKFARQKIYEIAKYYDIPVVVIECVCSPEEAKRRIKTRKGRQDGVYRCTNDPSVYDDYVKLFESTTKDMKDPKNEFVTFVEWDTEKNQLKELRVNKLTKNQVNLIEQALKKR